MVGGATAVSVIRLANFGNAAGKATITFIDPATGQTLATWASQDFPAHSSTQQRLDAVSAAATLEPAASLPAVVNLAVSATFPGTVQLLIGSSGTLTDASVCGVATTAPRERIAFVPVDTSQTRSWIRLVNSGSDAQVAHLVVRNAATGASLGTWTSASVPGRGATTVALAALLTEASVADGPTGFMIDSDQLPKGLRLELSAVDATSGGIADQTVSCALSGVGG
jgi:hypothetical protein